MKDIFVTATNTDIGKTFATIKLLEQYAKMGFCVGAFKPIETGVNPIAQDAKLLLKSCQKLNNNFKSITIDDICPIKLPLPAAPFVANYGGEIDFEKIKSCYNKIKEKCDIVFIEGAGGLLVPVKKDFFMIDFIKFFNAHTLLVTGDKLGCINDALLSLETLKNRELKTSWCINLHHNREDFETITLPFYEAEFEKIYILQDNLQELVAELMLSTSP